jgi:hypothetical protein
MFEAVARLSYTGDVRGRAAEDPLKVRRIVQGSLAAFRTLYQRPLQVGSPHQFPGWVACGPGAAPPVI